MRAKIAMFLGCAAVAAAIACGGGPPPPPPGPDPDSIAREQARRDSIAREQARRDSIERARQMEEQRVRREREEAEARAAAVTAEVRRMVAEMINFDFDRSNIREGRDMQVLQTKLAILQANAALRIEIVGHADERGSDEYNQALGMRRAIAARDFLVNRGIDASRITVRSMGEEQPLDPASNEAAWARNRRDEFNITAGGDRLVRPSGM
jgi:peptidoglycan-associated lipoprotein